MTPRAVVELAIACTAVMAPALWACWKTYGWEDILRRIARRCEIHDRAAPSTIRRLENAVGMEPSPSSGRFVDEYTNPQLIDCGHAWCTARRY